MLLFEQYVKTNKTEFINKVKRISALLGINPDWLMAVMQLESGINPQAVNRQPGDPSDPSQRAAYRAVGLIQFMPATARGLGTSTQQLYGMTNLQQLDYVYKYYKGYSGRINSFEDMYTVNFWPAALGKPLHYVMETKTLSASLVAKQNPVFDLNKDGKITYGEFLTAIRAIKEKQLGHNAARVFEKKK